MLVATEPSADVLGAALARAIKARLGEGSVRFVGIGGERMAAEGVVSPFAIGDLSIVGVIDGVLALPRITRRVRAAAALAQHERPDAAVLIDAWGFNVRLARRLRALKPRPVLIKYVVPQVWASRPWRARAISRLFDRLLALHAFDLPFYEREGASITLVGNPALGSDIPKDKSAASPANPRSGETLLILPGSRRTEVSRLMPAFEEAVAKVSVGRPRLRLLLAAAPAVFELVKTTAGSWSQPVEILEGEASRRDAMRRATVALACSGTVTTELALAGCPMVVAYRLDPLSYSVAKRLVTTPYVTLLNVAAGRMVAPEMIQGRCTGPLLAAELARLLDDPAARLRQIEAQTAALERLRGGVVDPIGAAADAVIDAVRPSGAEHR